MERFANDILRYFHASHEDEFMGIDVRSFKDRDPDARLRWRDNLISLIKEWWSMSPVTEKSNRMGTRLDFRLSRGDLSVIIKGQGTRFSVDVNGVVRWFHGQSHLYGDVMLWVDATTRKQW